MTIQDQIQALPDSEFVELKAWIVTTETDRRAALPAVEEAAREAKAEVVAEVAEKLAEKDTKLKPPAKADEKVRPWKAWHPLDTATHFYYSDLATNGGKTWRNVLDDTRKQPNVWEPNSPGIDERYWIEVVDTTSTGAGKAPTNETTPAETTPDGTREHPYEFKAGLNVKPGEFVTYQGALFKVVQGHTTASHWAPPDVASLFTKA